MLKARLSTFYDHLRSLFPHLDRMAYAGFDHKNCGLRLIFESKPEFPVKDDILFNLRDYAGLEKMAHEGLPRVSNNIHKDYMSGNRLSNWLYLQGHRSSLTFPLYHDNQFQGFLFFNSKSLGYFNTAVMRGLCREIAHINDHFNASPETSSIRVKESAHL